ncbi:MAG: LPS assembly protein LptD [Rickettsiales bacterium]|jgi:LPS-assembly protein|nr:LPS assembly protein LptD [Rickettsiales bacterium]
MVFKKIIFLSVFFFYSAACRAEVVEYKEINAEKINYNVKSGEIKTGGKTEVIGKSGEKLTLVDAYASKGRADGKHLLVEWDKRTLMTAETLSKSGNLTRAENVTYTACHNCDSFGNAWTVHATDMKHDSDKKNMYFYNFWFDMYGVPVFYLPYFAQPDPTVKYRSGLLIPEFGSASDLGTRIDVPLYLNFSANHDMTLTGAYLMRENPLLMAEHRLRLEHASFDTAGSYTYTKDGLNRWHLFHKEIVELGENMRLLASVQQTSDDTYLQKYGFYGDQPFLESNARLEMFAERGYATVEANIFQDLRQDIGTSGIPLPKGDILPKIHGTYQVGIADNLYSQFVGDVMRISDVKNDSSMNRAIGEARIIAPIEAAWQKWTLSAAVRSDYYQYDNVANAPDGDAGRILTSGYIDWEMPFVKDGGGWTQVVKPKARLTIMGKSNNSSFANMDSTGALLSDASLFVNNRYSGYDLWVNGTYADYGVSWTGYNSEGRSAEVFVGQTYDFDTAGEPEDTNSGYRNGASDVVGRVSISPSAWLNVTNRFRFDKGDWGLRHLETDVRLGGRSYVSVGYIWAVHFSRASDAYIDDADISEAVFGVGAHFTDRLAFRASGVYNFTNRIAQRYNAGLYYEHPCYIIGLVYNVDNALKTYVGNSEYDFKGVKSLKLKFSIKMGK